MSSQTRKIFHLATLLSGDRVRAAEEIVLPNGDELKK